MFQIKLKDTETRRLSQYRQYSPTAVTRRLSQYRQYSPTAVTNAMQKINAKEMSIYRASKVYNIPETTLRDRAYGRVDIETVKSGPSTLLTMEEEARLVNHLQYMASLGYRYTRSDFLEIASEYTFECGKRSKDNPLSRQWYTSFMSRWPTMKIKQARSLSLLRANAATQENIDKYFTELKTIMEKYDLLDKPHCIYNVDEKGASPEVSPPQVIAPVGTKPPFITSERSLTVTILGCGNAVGTQIPPYLVFPGTRMCCELLDGCSTGCDGTVSETGWSNTEIFKQYLQEHFMKYVQGLSAEQKILILYDGHKSHVSLELIDWAKQNNIILFVLPAHTSHLLQPLDVGCFGPLSRILNKEIRSYMRTNHTNVTRYTMRKLASKAYCQALSSDNLKSAFCKTCIYPLDTTVIQPEVLLPSTINSNADSDPIKDNLQDESSPSSIPAPDATTTASVDQNTKVESLLNVLSDFVNKLENNIGKGGDKPNSIKRNTLSKVVSGKAITEDSVVCKIHEHYEKQKKTASKRKSCVKVVKEKDVCKGNKENVFSASAKRKKVVKKHTSNSQQPGPSGLQKILISDSEFSSDESDSEEDKCCVCKKSTPDAFKTSTSLLILNWGQCMCGECKHWTHLRYCCDVNALRRHSVFLLSMSWCSMSSAINTMLKFTM